MVADVTIEEKRLEAKRKLAKMRLQEMQQTQSVFRPDTSRTISAPIGASAPVISYLDDVQNNGNKTEDYWGFNKIVDPVVSSSKAFAKGIGAFFVGSGETMEAGSRLKIADAINQGLTENIDDLYAKKARGDALTDEESRVLLRDIGSKNNLFSFLFSSPEDIVRERAKAAMESGDPMRIQKMQYKADRLKKASETLRKSANDIIQKNLSLSKDASGVDQFIYKLSQGASSLGTSIGAFAVTKNPAAAAALFKELQDSSVYLEARDAGVGVEKSRAMADLAGNLEAGLEYIGVDQFFKVAKYSSGLKKHLFRMGQEAIQEASQQLSEEFVTQASGIRKKDVEGALSRIGESALIGGIVGGGSSVVIDTFTNESANVEGLPKELVFTYLSKLENESDLLVDTLAADIEAEASPVKMKMDQKNIADATKIIGDFVGGIGQVSEDRQITASPEDRVDTAATITPEEQARYSGYVDEKPGVLEAPKRTVQGIAKGFDQLTLPISERLRAISEPLMYRLRRFEIGTKARIQEDERAIVPVLQKMRDMDKQDAKMFDIAMKNGDVAIIDKLAQKYNMTQEIQALRQTLNKTYQRAQEAGIDVGYREDFFPRMITDPEGLLNYLEDKEYWNVIEEAIRKKEDKLGKKLSTMERAEVANTLIRGFKTGDVLLAKPGAFKERSIEEITPELDKFYAPTSEALVAYAVTSNEAIEAAKLFGKGDDNIENSVGAFVDDLVTSGQINSKQAKEVKEIFGARFNRGKMTPGWEAFKNVAYLETMGSNIGSSITQITDLAITAYKMGIFNTLSSTKAAVMADTKVSLEDIGVQRIAQEFESKSITGKLVQDIFEWTQLSKIDRFGKRTLLEASYNKNLALAQKNDAAFNEKLDLMFGQDAAQVKQDLLAGNITENVKFIMANDLLDLQPIALSEMPEQYLRSGNGRIFYILKSFTLKQISIFRRDSINKILKGAKSGDAKEVAKGIGNFVKLLSFMTMAGVGRDYIWEFIKQIPEAMSGDEPEMPELDDRVVENIYKAFGLNKYTFDQMNRPYLPESPAGVFFGMIIPPTKTTDNLWRDWQKLQSKKGLDFKDMRALRSVPVGGELYWFWFGGGSGDTPLNNKQVNKGKEYKPR